MTDAHTCQTGDQLAQEMKPDTAFIPCAWCFGYGYDALLPVQPMPIVNRQLSLRRNSCIRAGRCLKSLPIRCSGAYPITYSCVVGRQLRFIQDRGCPSRHLSAMHATHHLQISESSHRKSSELPQEKISTSYSSLAPRAPAAFSKYIR